MTLQPAPAGLNVIGSGGREIGFGRDRPGVLASVTSITGTRPTAIACSAAGRDAYQVTGDLVIVFRGKAFAGWQTGTARAGEGC